MANTRKQKGILLLDKNKLDLYVVSMTTVVSLPIPTTIIRNMDIVNFEGFQQLLHTFLTTNKVIPASFSLILHENILFEKLFPSLQKQQTPATHPAVTSASGTTPSKPQLTPPAHIPPAAPNSASVTPLIKHVPTVSTPQPLVVGQNKQALEQAQDVQTKAIEHFIDTIPFEEVVAKRLKTAQGTLVIGANRDLIFCIKEAFEKEGFTIENAFPATMFGKEINLSTGLTPLTVQTLLSKTEAMKSQNMILDDKKDTGFVPVSPLAMPQKESDKKRLIAMTGVFGILLVVLVIFYFRMNAINATPPKSQAQPVITIPPMTITPLPQPTAAEATTSAALKGNTAVQITFSTQTASEAGNISLQLRQAGYLLVTSKSLPIITSQPTVTFSQNIPPDVQTEVTEIVSGVVPEIVAKQNIAGESGILISL